MADHFFLAPCIYLLTLWLPQPACNPLCKVKATGFSPVEVLYERVSREVWLAGLMNVRVIIASVISPKHCLLTCRLKYSVKSQTQHCTVHGHRR
ncbi:hypothetical protein F4780DRAFT_607747 [Xylariomycetidae sp. FL0641]|nr:hypothetical protein F4780DRAFT_607747 [Xylariomycetidae sp. FL0641]